MSWNNVKNIMIGLLIAVNVFLLINMGMLSFEHTHVDKRVLESAREVLLKSNIECPENLLPKYYREADVLRGSFFTIKELSEMFFGSEVPYGSDGKNVVAQKDGATLTIDGNSFSYTNGAALHMNLGEKELSHALFALGFDMEDTKYDAAQNMFYKYHDNIKCDGLYISASFDERGNLCFVSGLWPNISLDSPSESVPHVTQRIPELKKAFPSGAVVEKIELCYKMTQSGGTVRLSPAWRVYTDKGEAVV